MRTYIEVDLSKYSDFKRKMLCWAQQFREVIFLEGNQIPDAYSEFDYLLAIDAFTSIQTDSYNAFDDLNEYYNNTSDWLFGYLSYDLKNDVDNLESINDDNLNFPELYFFQPKKLFKVRGNILELHYLKMCDDERDEDLKQIDETLISNNAQKEDISIQQKIPKTVYLEKVSEILNHIKKGNIYEANFCMEFFAKEVDIDPLVIYEKLNSISASPFATFFKMNHHYALCASPERYLKKTGNTVITQPIKGTAKRYLDNEYEDLKSIENLKTNPKERSENIMIVDLVRNDLSKTAIKGSVHVKELCGIYTFKQVHQMISTVVSEVSNNTSVIDIIKTTFPMGSMTGAPKISAMNIIDDVEETKRGLYSGAIGYFTPQGDFDFNVVIRSILYNKSKKYLSYSVGSAITIQAQPEAEYEECLLKAKAMKNVLESN